MMDLWILGADWKMKMKLQFAMCSKKLGLLTGNIQNGINNIQNCQQNGLGSFRNFEMMVVIMNIIQFKVTSFSIW